MVFNLSEKSFWYNLAYFSAYIWQEKPVDHLWYQTEQPGCIFHTWHEYRGWLLHPVWYLNFRYPAANLKLPAGNLNSRPRILISGPGFESGFEDYSTNPRPTFLQSDIRLRFSSNLVLKLSREKKTNVINTH